MIKSKTNNENQEDDINNQGNNNNLNNIEQDNFYVPDNNDKMDIDTTKHIRGFHSWIDNKCIISCFRIF